MKKSENNRQEKFITPQRPPNTINQLINKHTDKTNK